MNNREGEDDAIVVAAIAVICLCILAVIGFFWCISKII